MKGFNEYGLVYSDGYAETMNEKVLPALAEKRKAIDVTGKDGTKLYASRYDAENPKGTVFIIHGFTENAEKFSELTYSLLENGWSVVAYDQRGHGKSGRDMGINDLSLTHVDKFTDYTDDLLQVTEAVKDLPKPWMIFGHSMGGAVTVMFLENHPGMFDKAVLCAPMIAPRRGGLPMWLSKLICGGARLLGIGKMRIFISKPWDGPEEFETSCATSRERFDWYDALKVKTEEYHNNGSTYSWTMEAISVTKKLLAKGMPEKVTIPVRLYTAKDDNQVFPEAQERIVARMPNAKRITVPGSKHEIYRSTDEVFFPWWQEILAFLEA